MGDAGIFFKNLRQNVKLKTMTNWKIPSAITFVAIAIGLTLQVWYWPQLPEKLATHFDAQGRANGWMDKQSATILTCSLVALMPLFFVGISVGIRWLPTSMINMPHREYWLSGERREETLRWMLGWMMWFSVAITIFFVAINHLIFLANRDVQPLSAIWFWGLLCSFLMATGVLVLIMLLRFSGPR